MHKPDLVRRLVNEIESENASWNQVKQERKDKLSAL